MSRHVEPKTASIPAWPDKPRWTAGEIIFLSSLLIIAILLRTIQLDQAPPGMQHDEVFDARFATTILDGARPVFIDENTGVPPLFMYLVAGAFSLMGRTVWALRLTSACVDVLGLLVSYLLLRELFGRRVALLTLAGLTISFWHLFDSRVGIEPIVVPLMTGLSFYLFWQALQRGSLLWYGLAGLSMGLAQYGHRSAPLIPLTAGLFALYLIVTRQSLLEGEGQHISRRRALAGLGMMLVITVLIAMPMIVHIATHPESMLRVQQLSSDLGALLDGDPGPVLENARGVLAMLSGIRGDPEWRYNIAGRPIFDPVTGILFWLGLGLCLWRWRRPPAAFLLLWLPVNLSMALITSSSPASTRILGAIAPIYAMPAIALVAGWDWLESKRKTRLKVVLVGLTALLLAGNLAWTVRDYFWVWPENSQVRTIYRADLAATARYLNEAQPEGTVCISAHFAPDLDQQIFDYMLQEERFFKWFDGQVVLPLPALFEEATTYIFPATAPAASRFRELLSEVGAEMEYIPYRAGDAAVAMYRLTADQSVALRKRVLAQPQYPLDINLSNEIDLIGYDLPAEARAGELIDLVVYWRPRQGGRGELSYAFFAHVLDSRGFLWAQDDPTGYPPSSWWGDDVVIQTFHLNMPADAPPGAYQIDLGFYEQGSGQRLARMNADGSLGPDDVQLQSFAVTSSLHARAEDVGEQIGAVFGDRIGLLGYSIDSQVLNLEERIEMALTWEAFEDQAGDVELELILTSEYGDTLPTIYRQLVDGEYPLSEWSAGQIVRDRFYLEHTPDIPRAIYDLELAVRDTESGAYLETTEGTNRVSLGQVFMRGLPD